jgi:hypothetical protein
MAQQRHTRQVRTDHQDRGGGADNYQAFDQFGDRFWHRVAGLVERKSDRYPWQRPLLKEILTRISHQPESNAAQLSDYLYK